MSTRPALADLARQESGYGANALRTLGTIVLDLGRATTASWSSIPRWAIACSSWASVSSIFTSTCSAKGTALDVRARQRLGLGRRQRARSRHRLHAYGLHARNLCGLEVVLPDGGLVRTGMGAMQGNHSWHLFPLSYGPDWTQMFTQSNLGVVTKAGVWLQPAPETSLLLIWDIPNEEWTSAGSSIRSRR